MARTRRYMAELVLRRLAGGDPSDDFQITIDEINAWLDFGRAAAAMKNYGDNASVDTENVADGFYITHKNLSLLKDAETGEYYTSLPSIPYALPRGYDIQGVYVEGSGQLSQALVRVHQQYLEYYRDLRMPPDASAYYVEGSEIRIRSQFVLDGMKIRVRMAGGATNDDLDAEFACPDDLIPFVVDVLFRQLAPTLGIKQDLSNDGVNVQ